MARVLVVGVMRSGKTTLAGELGKLPGVEVVEEPDNPLSRPFAFRVKRRLAQRYFPAPAPGEPSPEHELLWRAAFGLEGARPYSFQERLRRGIARRLLWSAGADDVLRAVSEPGSSLPRGLAVVDTLAVPERPVRGTDHVVVTANAPLSVEWAAELAGASVVVVTRNPLSVLASWAQLDWLGSPGHDMLDELAPEIASATADRLRIPFPPAATPPFVRAAWLLGLLLWHLRQALARNPDWHVVSYERLAAQPLAPLRALCEQLGVSMPERDEGALMTPLRGEPNAVRPDVEVEELESARAMLATFPLGEWGVSGPEDAVADAALDPADEAAQQDDELRQVGFRPGAEQLEHPLDP